MDLDVVYIISGRNFWRLEVGVKGFNWSNELMGTLLLFRIFIIRYLFSSDIYFLLIFITI